MVNNTAYSKLSLSIKANVMFGQLN